ncbi:MAG: hypothetical protein ACOC35_09065, partial [Promethearchaeia archaeon]
MNDTFFDRSKKRVIECIKKHLDLDVSDIPVMYVTNFEFYKCIKKNYKLRSESYEDIESVKERYRILCEIIPGMFKWKENKVYIKNEVESDFSLLLAELLHSKSITKGNASIRKWLSEGLVHYLEKILCKLCDIEYVESGHSDYFILREKVYDKYGLEVMKTIIFAEDIRITIRLLQHIFGYNDDDIL